jgi:prevent-host-death family protein
MTKTIKASEFKAKCLAIIEEIANTGEPLVVTKRGKPLVRVIPDQPKAKNAFGILKGQMKITGDIISPIDVEWEALK